MEEPRLELVVHLGDDGEERLALDPLLVEPEETAVGLPPDRGELPHRARLLQALDGRDGVEPAEVRDVLGRDDAERGAGVVAVVRDDDAADPVLHHHADGVEEAVRRAERDRRALDEVHHRGVERGAGRDDLVDEVALGEEPHRAPVLHDHDGVALVVAHELSRLPDRRRWLDGEGLAVDDVPEVRVEEEERAARVHLRVERADVLLEVLVEVPGEDGVVLVEVLEVGRGEERADGGLHGLGLVREDAALEQPVRPEDGPLPDHVDQPVLLVVEEPDEAGLDDVERAVDVGALLEDDLARLVDLERHVADEVAAFGGREVVEGGRAFEQRGEALGDRAHEGAGEARGDGRTTGGNDGAERR